MASTRVYIMYVLLVTNTNVMSILFKTEERKLPEFEDIKELLGTEKDLDLWTVGMYIAAHKYFGADMRYQAGVIDKEDYIFHKQFPVPRLRRIHKALATVCEKSAMDCVQELVAIARKSGSLQQIMSSGMNTPKRKSELALPIYSPFKTRYEDFRFRTTAMYYLCWHTLRKDKYLHFSNTRLTCLEYLNFVTEVPYRIRKEISGVLEDPRNRRPYIVADMRDVSKLQYYQTDLCARLWFCPDPCYGRKDYGNMTHYDLKKDKGNPCGDLPDPICEWKESANNNFHDLIRNKFNITCKCESKSVGFEWNNKFGLCVDQDECYDNTHRCSHTRVCRNNVGSYSCMCPRGFVLEGKTAECVNSDMLHDAAIILDVKDGLGSTPIDDNDLIDDIMEIFGFSACARVAASLANVLCFILFWAYLLYII